MAPSRFRTRALPQPLVSAILLLVWLLASNRISTGLLLLGAMLAVVIPLVTQAARTTVPRRVRLVPLAGLLALLLLDIAIANLRVALLILGPASRLRPRFFMVPLDLRDPAGIAALASIISLTPGTVSASLTSDRRNLLVHGLDVADEAEMISTIKTRYERRLLEILT